jgi:hypothetical protein
MLFSRYINNAPLSILACEQNIYVEKQKTNKNYTPSTISFIRTSNIANDKGILIYYI